MRRLLQIIWIFPLCLSFLEGAHAQSQFHIGPTVGVKHSLSISKNLNGGPTRGSGTYDSQGGIIFGYGNDRLSIESGLVFGTLGVKNIHDSPLIIAKQRFNTVYRTKDLLSIILRGYFTWGGMTNNSVIIFGNSLGVNMNIQYSKNLDLSVTDQQKSLQGDNGQYILTYDDILLGREETNFSIASGLFTKWKVSPRFDLRAEFGLNFGIDPLNVRGMYASPEYIDPTGENSWTSVGHSTTLTYSKGDHLFFNLSVLYHAPQNKKKPSRR